MKSLWSVRHTIAFPNANRFALTRCRNFIHVHDPRVGDHGFNHVILLGLRRELLGSRLRLVERRRQGNTVERERLVLDLSLHVHRFVHLDQRRDAVSPPAIFFRYAGTRVK